MVKRLYQVVSLLAVVLVFALLGLGGYLYAKGRLTPERVDQIAALLRGESLTPPAPATQPSAAPVKPETANVEIERSQEQRALYAMVAERQKRELEDRARLNRRIQYEVVQKLEEVQRREAELQAEREALAAEQMQDGFARELEVFSTISPARSRDLLMERKDADVVRLFMEMDESRVKRIIDTCKKAEEMEWAGRILDQLHTQSDARAGAEAIGSSQTQLGG
jgi:hypothetical protein